MSKELKLSCAPGLSTLGMAPTALSQTVAVPLDAAVMARTGSPVANTILAVIAALTG